MGKKIQTAMPRTPSLVIAARGRQKNSIWYINNLFYTSGALVPRIARKIGLVVLGSSHKTSSIVAFFSNHKTSFLAALCKNLKRSERSDRSKTSGPRALKSFLLYRLMFSRAVRIERMHVAASIADYARGEAQEITKWSLRKTARRCFNMLYITQNTRVKELNDCIDMAFLKIVIHP